MVKRYSSLQRTHFHCSRVQWRWALQHSSWLLALRMVILGLCMAAQSWKPISWSSRWTILVLTLLPEAVCSECCRQFFFYFSTRRSRSVSLCGLPLRGWAVVAPRHFHFTITELTFDRGSSSRAEIWRTDLLERWHPKTVPRWKWLSPSVRQFYWQCLSMKIAWLCSQFDTPVSNGCGWNRRIH